METSLPKFKDELDPQLGLFHHISHPRGEFWGGDSWNDDVNRPDSRVPSNALDNDSNIAEISSADCIHLGISDMHDSLFFAGCAYVYRSHIRESFCGADSRSVDVDIYPIHCSIWC
jgi:hypothetical protein